ncbi:MAG TPA: DUF805 domain-containing protein [Agrococcus sp.]|nr:DUF805 domain-containing protein [Agrococcus sp.]
MSTPYGIPVGQPLPGASFGQAVRRFITGYVRFSGRASRSEFWWAYLFTFLVSIVASVPYWIVWGAFMASTLSSAGSATDTQVVQDTLSLSLWLLVCLGILLVVSLALLLPLLAAMWRRLQDANFHGAISLATVVGFGIVPLIMCVFPSSPAGVQYDPSYRAQQAAAYAQGAYGYAQVGPAAPGYASAYAQAAPAAPGYASGYAQPGVAQPGAAYGEPFTQPPAAPPQPPPGPDRRRT